MKKSRVAQQKTAKWQWLWWIAAPLLVVAGGVGAVGALRIVAPRYSVAPSVILETAGVSAQTAPDLVWPEYGQAAVAEETLGVVATHGELAPHPTASTAKLITVLAVLEKKPLAVGETGPVLTLTQADVDRQAQYVARNGSNTAVTVGEELTQYQALQSILLASSNNMADTLAIWAFGSLEAYHSYAATMLERLGASQTTVAEDASGLSPATTSTAHDLALIGLAVLKQPVLAEIVAQASATVPVAGTIYNTNSLLLTTNDVVGIKTGETVEAGGNFVLAARQTSGTQSHLVVTVVMGAPVSSEAIAASYQLYRSATPDFAYTHLLNKGDVIATYSIPRGAIRRVVAAEGYAQWSWQGSVPPAKVTLQPLTEQTISCSTMGSVSYGATSVNVALVAVAPELPCS